MLRRSVIVIGILSSCTAPVRADAERYEVGQRLVEFEESWEKYRRTDGKKRAIKYLLPLVPIFFAARWSEAARLLDQARYALMSKDQPPAAQRWADSLYVKPERRLLDDSAEQLAIKLDYFYKNGLDIPKHASVVAELKQNKKTVARAESMDIRSLPTDFAIRTRELPEGDYTLLVKILARDKPLAADEQLIAIVNQPHKRLKKLKKGLARLPNDANGTDAETVRYLAKLLERIAQGKTQETDYPAARLFAEAEAALKALQSGESFYGGDKTGQYWLRLATRKRAIVTRLFAPKAVKEKKPLPLVVALHGAGGSENLFFESYGKGLIVDLCKKRGWLLAAPRSPTLAFDAPVADIVEAVARLYAIDQKSVFVVGHSMGAAQAIRAAQDTPKQFAAVAALGGSGKIRSAEVLECIPFFIGVGTSDFALEGARRMAAALRNGGVKTVQMRQYPDIEHIMLVREALPDVFAFFDKIKP